MPETPTNPPPEKMVRMQNEPNHIISLFSELVSRESTRFQALSPVKRGTIYATTVGADQRVIDSFDTLYFVKEFAPYGSNSVNSMPGSEWVIWTWATKQFADDNFNAEISYLGDAVANPMYVRVSKLLRETYETTPTIALGSPLTALIGIKITAAGTGYTTATVGISGTGTGAEAQAVLDASGGVSSIIVTKQGVGYTAAPTITITGDGSGATATGIIQVQAAILTSQKKQELPDTDPLASQFVAVIRTYEVLPGPYLPFTRWSDLLGPIQGTRRAVVWASQAATLTATAKTTYEAREGSSYVAWELVETNSNGTGSAGNPAYPIFTEDIHDNDKGEVQRVTQVVVATGSEASSSTVSGSTVTHIDYLKIDGDPFHLIKLIETWTVPRALTGKETNSAKQVATVTTTRKAPGSDATPTALKDVQVTNKGDGTVEQVEKDIPAVFDEDRRSIEIPDVTPAWARALLPTTTKGLKTAGTSVSDPTLGTGDLQKTVERVDSFDIKTTTVNRDPASLPKTRTNKVLTTDFGGGLVDEVETIAVGVQTASTGGLLIVDGTVEVLGDGTSAKKVSTVEGTEWPVLTDSLFDEEMRVQYDQTRQVVAAGTAAPSGGTTATANLTIAGGIVTVATVVSGGTGYVGAPTFSYQFLINSNYTITSTNTVVDIAFPTSISGILRPGDKIAFAVPLGNFRSQGVFFVKSVNTGANTFRISLVEGGVALVPNVTGSFVISPATQQNGKTDVFVRDSSVMSVGQRWGFYLGGTLAYYYIVAVVDTGHVRISATLGGPAIIFSTSFYAPYNTLPELSNPPVLVAVIVNGIITSLTISSGGSGLPSGLAVIISDPVFAYHAEVQAIDKWRSRIITVVKNPPNSEQDAIVSYANKPYTFPGRLVPNSAPYIVQKATADLVQVVLKTWWIKSVLAPLIDVPPIITHSVQVVEFSIDPGCGDVPCYSYHIARIDNVLHDSFFNGAAQFFEQSTPSYSEYMGLSDIFILTGDLTFALNSTTVTGSGTLFTTELAEGDIIFAGYGRHFIVDSIASDTSLGLTSMWPFPTATVLIVPAQTQFTGWIDNLKIIGASVVPAKERNLWKVQTESTIMR